MSEKFQSFNFDNLSNKANDLTFNKEYVKSVPGILRMLIIVIF